MPTHVTNTQKRAFIVPEYATPNGPLFAAVVVDPGQTAQVEDEHWQAVTHKNHVITALLDGGHLQTSVTTPAGIILPESLTNPAPPVAPVDLTAPVEGAPVESKTTLTEVDLQPDADAPAEAPRPAASGSKRKA